MRVIHRSVARRGFWPALGVWLVAGCQGAPTPHPAPQAARVAAVNGPAAVQPTAPGVAAVEPGHGAPGHGAPGHGAPGQAANEPGAEEKPGAAEKEAADKDDVAPLRVRAEGQLGPGNNTLFIDIAPPDGAKLTLESPLAVRGSGGIGLSFPQRLNGPLSKHSMPLRLPIEVADGATGPARLEVSYYWCTDGNEAACRREQAHLDVELDLTGANPGGEAHVSYRARGDKS